MDCKLCSSTCYIITEGFRTSKKRVVFADLRFDAENSEIDINYGLLDAGGYQGKDTAWSKSYKFKYCPECGRKF